MCRAVDDHATSFVIGVDIVVIEARNCRLSWTARCSWSLVVPVPVVPVFVVVVVVVVAVVVDVAVAVVIDDDDDDDGKWNIDDGSSLKCLFIAVCCWLKCISASSIDDDDDDDDDVIDDDAGRWIAVDTVWSTRTTK
jgi:hypothetical protein